MYSPEDLIIAAASAPGLGARGIVRLSGPGVLELLADFFLPFNGLWSNNFSLMKEISNGSPCIIKGSLFLWRDVLKTNDSSNRLSHGSVKNFYDGFVSDDSVATPCIDSIVSPSQDFFVNISDGPSIPCELYYWGAGRGFTGQTSVELHLIGAPPIIDRTITALCQTGKVRLAMPGEFTLRAFLSGRIDLTQAEAILGVIDAQEEGDLYVALEQLAGGLRRPLMELGDTLLTALADLEAGLDFSDTDNNEIVFITSEELFKVTEAALKTIKSLLEQIQERTGRSETPRVVLWGRPNSGKSSLFNALSARYAQYHEKQATEALVSSKAGTTRDYLEQTLKTKDLIWTLIDTAGVMDSPKISDQMEQKAQSMTESLLQQADLILHCCEPLLPFLSDNKRNEDLVQEDLACDVTMSWNEKSAALEEMYCHKCCLKVITKKDLFNNPVVIEKTNTTGEFEAPGEFETPGEFESLGKSASSEPILTSAQTGEGLEQLVLAIESKLREEHFHSEIVPSTAHRCRESLQQACDSLEKVQSFLTSCTDDVLVAMELRHAWEQIGLMVGTVHTDDILDRIFSRFCIGK